MMPVMSEEESGEAMKTIRIERCLLTLTLCVFAVGFEMVIPAQGGEVPRPKYQFNEPYLPHQKDPISFDRPMTCVFQTFSVAGYQKKDILEPDSELLERAEIYPDDSPNVWKITLHDKTADLLITGGGWEDIKNETWAVVSKTDQYLILVSVHDWPVSIRTITINAKFGTFVQCFNGQGPFGANQGTVTWGYCTNN
jgi:hypothetical protein